MRSDRSIHPGLYFALLAVIARLVPGPRTIDDAYISFRYARNLLAGNGMVYNPGEQVFGASTPAFISLLAGLALFFGGASADFPTIAWIVSALADGVTCWLLIRLAEALGRPKAGMAAALVWAIAPWSVTFAIGGMETSLFVMLATGAFLGFATGRRVQTALLSGLAIVTRPDALLFVLPLGLARLRDAIAERKKRPAQLGTVFAELAAFLVPVATWLVFGLAAYGNPVPHSMAAKVAAYRIEETDALVRLLQHYATPFGGHNLLGRWWIGAGLVVFPALAILGAQDAIRRKAKAWPIVSYPWIYFMAFAIVNPLIFRWYLTPPLPMYMLSIFLGIGRIARDFKRPALLVGSAVIMLTLALSGWTLVPDHGPQRPAPEMAYIELELLYQHAAQSLKPDLPPGAVVAAGDIGAVGYFTDAAILDTLGLVSPRAASYYPQPKRFYVINYAIAPDLILETQPDYLIMLEVYGRQGLLLYGEFHVHYELVSTIPTSIYGSEDMLIFKRRGN